MKIRLGLPDTIAWRIAMTVGAAIIGVLILSAILSQFTGPTAREVAGLDRADDTVRMIDAASAIDRPRLASAVDIFSNKAEWYPAASPTSRLLAAAKPRDASPHLAKWFWIDGRQINWG